MVEGRQEHYSDTDEKLHQAKSALKIENLQEVLKQDKGECFTG